MTLTPDAINEQLARHWPAAAVVCTEVGAESATARLKPGKSALRPGGFISGPTQFAAADAALWFLAFGAAQRIEPLALTSDLAIRFLRPAEGESLTARATLNRYRRRTVIGTISVWVDDREDEPCATAQGTYILPG